MAAPRGDLPSTVTELLSLKLEPSGESDPSTVVFTTVHAPAPMGFSPYSFGGCTMGMATIAACQTLAPNQSHFRAYSLLGNFLGPALVDRKLKAVVRKVRDTRTFATRVVELKQKSGQLDSSTGDGLGEERTCLFMTIDFQAPEKESEMVYSTTINKRVNLKRPEDERNMYEIRDDYIARGLLDEATIKLAKHSFSLAMRYFDMRYGTESPLGQSLLGIARRRVPLPQQDLPHSERVSLEWIRIKAPLGKGPTEQLGALVFAMDFATSFIPLSHDGRWLGDLAASSSLEFALRIFENEFDMNEWHIMEKSSAVAKEGRGYTENKLFDSTGTRLLASMTQQVIMRPKPKTSSNL